MKNFIKNNIWAWILVAFATIILSVSLKSTQAESFFGIQSQQDHNFGSPFEISITSSRYYLVEAMVDYGTFFFNEDQAKNSAPDISFLNGKYFSIFTPGVSMMAVPLYVLGKSLGAPQIITFLLNPMTALLNVYLVVVLARNLGANKYEGLFGGLIFLFATNTFAYTSTLAQHHLSTTLILLALLNIAQKKRTLLKNGILGCLYGVGLLIDIPNGIVLLPIILYVVSLHFGWEKKLKSFKASVDLSIVGLLIGLLPLLALFGWYNYSLTGSYFALGQSLGRSDYPNASLVENQDETKILATTEFRPFSIFETRRQLFGAYIFLISDERGVLFYFPVIVIGFLGLYHTYKNQMTKHISQMSLVVIFLTLVLYSMHGDPWGGWAFGSRYMIPVSAILGAGIAVSLKKYSGNILFGVVLMCLAIYSVAINTAGTITTLSIPPKVEAVNLLNPVPYTYQLNFDFIAKNISSSLIYNLSLSRYMTVWEFYVGVVTIISILLVFSLFFAWKSRIVEKGKA